MYAAISGDKLANTCKSRFALIDDPHGTYITMEILESCRSRGLALPQRHRSGQSAEAGGMTSWNASQWHEDQCAILRLHTETMTFGPAGTDRDISRHNQIRSV